MRIRKVFVPAQVVLCLVCDVPTDGVQGHCSWLGAWGRIAPILPSLLFAERGQQGGKNPLFLFSRGFGGEVPIASFFVPAQDAGLK